MTLAEWFAVLGIIGVAVVFLASIAEDFEDDMPWDDEQ